MSIFSQSGAMGLCTEFNSQQLLFEAVPHIMRIFSSVEPQNESTFPFQSNIIFETDQSGIPELSFIAYISRGVLVRVKMSNFFRSHFGNS